MITFNLAGGQSVSVDAYKYSRTYATLMDGLPNARLNRLLLDEAQKKARLLWGKRKVYLVPPECDRSEPESPKLPASQYIVWLICHEPVSPRFSASELVVVFYSNLPEDTPITKILKEHLGQLRWEHLAFDFDW
jgi:hypothetical protein